MASLLEHDFGSDSEGDDFNPAQQVDSEDEVRPPRRDKAKAGGSKSRRSPSPNSEDDDDDDDEVQVRRKDKRVKNGDRDEDGGNESQDDENDDDEEDEDEEDEDEDDDEPRPRKRYKRTGGAQFIDQEAEVTEEEDEDEDEDDGDLGDEPHPEDLARVADEHDDRKHRLLDQQRQRAEEIDAEKQAEALRQRYRTQRVTTAEISTIPQDMLLPSVQDPSIYGIKCKPGKEHEVVMAILRRIAETPDSSLAGVTSVFAREKAMSGYVYVEAEKRPDVGKATEDINFCYANQVTVIPITEMPDLLRVKKPKDIKSGSFVRMKRPARYAGDLAQVIGVEVNNSEVTVKLVPRLEFADEENGAAAAKRKRPGGVAYRPPQKLFSDADASKRHLKFQGGRKGVFYFQGEEFENGFLIKNFKMTFIDSENVNPTLEEATKFSLDGDDKNELDLTALAASLRQAVSGSDFVPGDMVEVFQGEQQGLRGKTIAVHSNILTFEVSRGSLKGERIDSPIKALRKLFEEGDNVKVLAGSKYNGETGIVLNVNTDFVTILTDSNNEQIKLFSKDLRVAVDAGGGAGGNSKYSLFDLVQLDATKVGCIIKVDRETVKVIDQEGTARVVLPSVISAKLDKKRQTVATDRNGTQIQVEDTVKELAGSQRRGEIIGVHRNFLFVKDKLMHKDLGVWATRSSNVEIVSAKGARPTDGGVDISRMNPDLMRHNPNGSMAPPQRAMGRDRLEGRIVMITRGDYKGMVGRVKTTNSNTVSVELEARSSKFPTAFPRDLLKVQDPITKQFHAIGAPRSRVPLGLPGTGGSSSSGFGNLPSRMPSGSRTPMGASDIPGGRTPAWAMADGGRSPSWKRDGGGSGFDGGRTPAWAAGGGAKTPAWGGGGGGDYGGRTVLHQSDGSRTAYAGNDYSSGSKTPAYGGYSAPTPGASSRIPSSRNAAPTPGAFDPPTPGGYLGAPTPGAIDAPTPRGYGGTYGTPAAAAPTPGAAFAETPAAFPAETPAPFGGDDDDDGPRYD